MGYTPRRGWPHTEINLIIEQGQIQKHSHTKQQPQSYITRLLGEAAEVAAFVP